MGTNHLRMLATATSAIAVAAVICAISPIARAQDGLTVEAELDMAPGNLTHSADGRTFISLHQLYMPPFAVAEIVDGDPVPFPDASWHDPASPPDARLFAVLGVQVDAEGILWMLDDAVGFDAQPKLVGWDLAANALHQVVDLGAAVAPNSFLNDLAVDRTHDAVYITDTAFGPNAALVVVDLTAGTARRVLDSHPTTMPEDVELAIEGTPVRFMQPDGSTANPRFGADAIALDAADEWLYFGALSGTALYRVATADLRDATLDDAALGARVERFADKPLSDGIALDNAGNVYITDIAASAIGVIHAGDRSYRVLHQDRDLLAWPDALSYGPDGRMHVSSTQLHRSPVLNGGENAVVPPFLLTSFASLAEGTVGR